MSRTTRNYTAYAGRDGHGIHKSKMGSVKLAATFTDKLSTGPGGIGCTCCTNGIRPEELKVMTRRAVRRKMKQTLTEYSGK
jgi:hypothetical protein